ncbi:MAG: hypothetical protein BGO41_07285 [Clostridiales bacterium 38-18]|nr:MAG: hypothetical protein BGO41_07285 [Clostridiales bacterium 38-18]
MYKNGTVVSIADKMAVIEVIRTSACGENCASCKGGCQTNGILVKVENTLEAQKGDIVRIDADTKRVLKFSSVFYLIPLVFLMVGILGTSVFLKGSDLVSLLVGTLLLAISLFLIHKLTKDSHINFKLTSVIRRF